MSRKLPYWHVDAFADRPFAGNQAAVMPLDAWLDDARCWRSRRRTISPRPPSSCTTRAAQADWELRWFTPAEEMRLCGHATLASGHVLLSRDGGERVDFPHPPGGRARSGARGAGLRTGAAAIRTAPRRMGRSGRAARRRAVGSVAAAPIATASICSTARSRCARSIPTCAGCVRSGTTSSSAPRRASDTDVVSRVFVPGGGVDEDSFTGSAHAALTHFWTERLGRDRFTAHPGLAARRRCDLPARRRAGGAERTCVTVVEGSFLCPSEGRSMRPGLETGPGDRPRKPGRVRSVGELLQHRLALGRVRMAEPHHGQPLFGRDEAHTGPCGRSAKRPNAGPGRGTAGGLRAPGRAVEPGLEPVLRALRARRHHRLDPAARDQLLAAVRPLVAQQLAELRPVARGGMHQAAADQRARAVEFGHHRWSCRAGRTAAPGDNRPPPCAGHRGLVASVSARAAMSARITVVLEEYSNLLPGSASSGCAVGPIGHVVAPVEKQHAHLAALVRRVARLGVLEPAAHLQQMAQGDLGARIAGALPARHRRGLVQPQAPVGDEHADHHRGDRLGHRPADEARVAVIARGIAFGGELAVRASPPARVSRRALRR